MSRSAKSSYTSTRSKRAASFIEMACGLIVVIPLVLLFVDLGAVGIGFMMNGDMAKKCARAAAAAADGTAAVEGAQNIVAGMNSQQSLARITLAYLRWQPPSASTAAVTFGSAPKGTTDPAPGQVLAVTTVVVRLPAPLPMLGKRYTFHAPSVQPIVGVGATLPTN